MAKDELPRDFKIVAIIGGMGIWPVIPVQKGIQDNRYEIGMAAYRFENYRLVVRQVVSTDVGPGNGATLGGCGNLNCRVVHFVAARHVPVVIGELDFFGHDTMVFLYDIIKNGRIRHLDHPFLSCDPLEYYTIL